MINTLKRSIKNTSIYRFLDQWRLNREIIEWEKNGKPIPPPHAVKQRAIRNLAQQFNLKIMVETGTYRGHMINAMKRNFDKIYSIELSQELYKMAKIKFKGETNIELIQGDSGIELKALLKHIDQPSLFWLDGHYSGGITAKGSKNTPIYEELTHIFNASDRGHVIMIDDARCFESESDYPSFDELITFIRAKRPNVDIYVEEDIIRILPNRELSK